MESPQVKTWRQVRARRSVDEQAVSDEIARLAAQVRECRLREIRDALGITQVQLAQALELTQPTVSILESGDIERSAIATVRAYVGALGGSLEVTACFGDERIVLSGADRTIATSEE